MATLRAKVDSFQDSGKLLEWAEALEIHQDPIVLDRLAILRSGSADRKLLFAQYLILLKSVLLRTIYNTCFCFLLDESWSLPDSLPEPESDLSWWDSDIFADQSILTETPREVDSRIEWWDQSLFDEPDQEEETEPDQDQTAMTDQGLPAKADQDEPTELTQIPGAMRMDEPMETAEAKEADQSGTKSDSTPDPEGAPREWWDDSFQNDLEAADFREAADFHEAAESGQVSSPVTAPDAPRAAEWWDDSFDATDEALLLDSDNCKFFGFLFL